VGKYISALVAGPPSPEYPLVPFPTTVVMVPDEIGEVILRSLLLLESVKYRLPDVSNAIE
jgi:hypothetical protein